ncbi:MAG TPA: RNA polymerase sigma factor [Ktedonobacteraceae bacterium]|nr:RNA polymerase sigma factor [Ktedonobacteraceae bacterium]
MLTSQDDFDRSSPTQVIEHAQAGNCYAFNVLVRHFEPEIHGYIAGLVGSSEEAYDLTQETMLRVWQKLPTLQDVLRFKPWLYSIARNRAYDYLRRQQRHPTTSLQSLQELQADKPGLIVSDFSGRVEEAELLQQALKELPPKLRDCLLLQSIGKFSQQEIADLLNMSKGSVAVYVSKARKQLRETLQRLGAALGRQEEGGPSDE